MQKKFFIDPDHEVAGQTEGWVPRQINDIPELNKESHGEILCDVETLLKQNGKIRTYLNECLDKYFKEIMSSVHDRVGVYITDVRKEVKRISARNKN